MGDAGVGEGRQGREQGGPFEWMTPKEDAGRSAYEGRHEVDGRAGGAIQYLGMMPYCFVLFRSPSMLQVLPVPV